ARTARTASGRSDPVRGTPAHGPATDRPTTAGPDADPAAAVPLVCGSAAVVALGSLDPAEACRALRAAGVDTVPEPAGAALTLVVCADYLDPALGRLDAEHRAAGRRWLPVKPDGAQTWIGPLLGDPDGPCWACLADRLWRGRRAEAHLLSRLGRTAPLPRPAAALPAARTAGLHLAAVQAAGWLAGLRHPAQSQLWTVDGLTSTGERHSVQRRPQCPACGNPELVAERVRAPFALAPEPGRTPAPGATGAWAARTPPSPRQLLERYSALVGPVTGLVSEIRRDPRGPESLNCFHAAYRPPPGALDADGAPGLDGVRAGLRATAHGKGTTAEQAEAGALCEALEQHSGYRHGDEPRHRARYCDLGPEAAVHPDAVQLYDPRQFADRERWNAEQQPQHRVCDPFDEEAEIDWTPVWSITAERHRLLPTALLYYGEPQPPGRHYCLATSNGAAAGDSPADAVLRGFLELVERDAVALWWYNRSRQPVLALDGSLADAETGAWVERIRRVHADLGREVWALDLTTDLGIPVVAALSRRTDGPAEEIVLGFGAHFDWGTALRRALAELNQMLPPLTDPDHARYAGMDPVARRWFATAALADQPYLRPDPAAPPVPAAALFRPPPGASAAERVGAVRDLLRDRGLELLVLDQTRPDVGLPVVKVLVPGLRPHWARFAPGRLFDVPVSLGRIHIPTAYSELNPVPLFL
ncbi:TOMM precursor leader peptide-binding protein, partial [Streptomyces palmae]